MCNKEPNNDVRDYSDMKLNCYHFFDTNSGGLIESKELRNVNSPF